jgi:hypothetical protein
MNAAAFGDAATRFASISPMDFPSTPRRWFCVVIFCVFSALGWDLRKLTRYS